jgi:ribosomal protein S11
LRVLSARHRGKLKAGGAISARKRSTVSAANIVASQKQKSLSEEQMTPKEAIMGANVGFLHGVPVHPTARGADAIIASLEGAGFKIVRFVARDREPFDYGIGNDLVFPGNT